MSKEKAGSAKPEKTYEEVVEAMELQKTNLSTLKTELRDFRKENGIKKGKVSDDKKIAAQVTKKEAVIEKAQAEFDATKLEAKALKPQKDRVSKYEYPADCVTDKDKKRYRAKMRRDAKAPKKDEKVAEGDESAEAPKEEAKTTKKKKKIVKKTKTEEED